MSDKSTPGPWIVVGNKIRCFSQFRPTGQTIVAVPSGDLSIEDKANLKLIACLPELLDELRAYQGAVHSDYCSFNCTDRCKELQALLERADS